MLPTWLFDTFTADLDRALHYTALWGLEGLELRTMGSVADRVPHVNEAKLMRRLLEHEMPVVAVVPGLFEGSASDRVYVLNEVALLRETLAFCRRVECPRVVISGFMAEDQMMPFAVEALRRAGDAAAQADVTLAVLNEPDMACATGHALAALLEAVDHAHVQAAWAPASACAAGENPAEGLAALAGHVALVRCADGRLAGERWKPTGLGDGVVGWPSQLQQLHAQGFDGPVSLELHLGPKARQGARDAYTLIQLVRAAQQG